MRRLGSVLLAASILGCGRSAPPPSTAEDWVRLLVIADRPADNQPVYTVPEIGKSTTDANDPRYRAQEAAQRLQAMGMDAWPALLAALDDKRQSIALASEIPCSVGLACFHIIADAVNPDASKAFRHDYMLLAFNADLREWWNERKGRTLRELRVEAALFSWALARHDKEAAREAEFLDQVKALGVENPVEASKDLRELIEKRCRIPDTPEALVSCLGGQTGASYMERRIDDQRANRAWWKLLALKLAAFPALIRGLANPETADVCFNLIVGVLYPYSISEYPDLIAVDRAGIGAWWKQRQEKTLLELQVEVTRDTMRAAERKAFASSEEKQSWLKFLREQLEKLERSER